MCVHVLILQVEIAVTPAQRSHTAVFKPSGRTNDSSSSDDGEGDDEEGSGGGDAPKARAMYRRCVVCRVRKLKCDFVRPCGFCTSHGFEEVCVEVVRKINER